MPLFPSSPNSPDTQDSPESEPSLIPGSEIHWYEVLELLVPYRDLLLVLGFLVIVFGIGMLSKPGAVIFGGVGLILLSWLMSR